MRPLRMCMVCRRRSEKQELIRLSCPKGGEPQIDYSGLTQGRGMYICKTGECIRQAEKRHVIERAFGCKADKKLYSELFEFISEEHL